MLASCFIKNYVLFWGVSGPPEVSQFGYSLAQKNVLRFEISVQDRLRVTILECFYHLLRIVGSFFFFDLSILLSTGSSSFEKRHF